MDFNATNAAAVSVVTSLLVLATFYMAVAAAPGWLPLNLLYVLGTAIVGFWTKNRASAYATGLVLLLGGSILLGLVLARLHQAFGLQESAPLWGVVAGTIFWIVAGGLMAGLDSIHPLIRKGHVRLTGPYGREYGLPVVIALWLSSAAFGALFSALYQVW